MNTSQKIFPLPCLMFKLRAPTFRISAKLLIHQGDRNSEHQQGSADAPVRIERLIDSAALSKPLSSWRRALAILALHRGGRELKCFV